MLRREAELRGHPTTQRVLDNIEINNQDHFQLCTIGDEWCEAVLRRIGRMKSGELKVQLRQLGLNAKGSTATLRSAAQLRICLVTERNASGQDLNVLCAGRDCSTKRPDFPLALRTLPRPRIRLTSSLRITMHSSPVTRKKL